MISVKSEGEESARLALVLFRAHLGAVYSQLKDSYGLDWNLDDAMRHEAAEVTVFFPPAGRLLVAREDTLPIGIVCLAPLGSGAGEVKHLYVEPGHRGRGIGGKLMGTLIGEGRSMGLDRLCLDSGSLQTDAHRLYRTLGFVETPRYAGSKVPDSQLDLVIFMHLAL